MRKLSVVACALLVALGLSAGHAWSQEIAIQVSPNTLNLDSEGTWVTVHATIPFSAVDLGSVTLTANGADVAISSFYADARGDLVTKSSIDAVKGKVDVGSATFTLSGLSKTGEPFSGSDTIRVIDCKGK